jgi:hypothetical protein
LEKENYEKLTQFKTLLEKTHHVSYFASVKDLAQKIEHDVPRALKN